MTISTERRIALGALGYRRFEFGGGLEAEQFSAAADEDVGDETFDEVAIFNHVFFPVGEIIERCFNDVLMFNDGLREAVVWLFILSELLKDVHANCFPRPS